MRIINKTEQDLYREKFVCYEFDKIDNLSDILSILNSLKNKGYLINQYKVILSHDHSEQNYILTSYSYDEFLEIVQRLKSQNIENLSLNTTYQDMNVLVNLTMETNVLSFSFPKKKKEVVETKSSLNDTRYVNNIEQNNVKFYRYLGGKIVKHDTTKDLFYSLNGEGNWRLDGHAMSKYFDSASEFVEIDFD